MSDLTDSPAWTPMPWDNLPPDPQEDWPRCLDCGTQYPPDWLELRWHIVHGCSGGSWGLSECPGVGCLCLEPVEVVAHWCEACDGEDPRSCPARMRSAGLVRPGEEPTA